MFSEKRQMELLHGDIPQNKEEQEWIKLRKKEQLKRQQTTEDYHKRFNAAKKEALELLEKEKKKKGFNLSKFNNPLFKVKEKKIDKLVQEELEKHPEVMEDGNIDAFLIETKIKLFKEKYNIDWIPFEGTLSDEFIKEYVKIKEKYNIQCDVL